MPEPKHNFVDSIQKLANVICDTRNRHVRKWSLCNSVTITPTLAYLNEFTDLCGARSYQRSSWVTVNGLLEDGLTMTDVLATLQQNHEIITIATSSYSNTSSVSLAIVDLSDDLDHVLLFNSFKYDRPEEGWRTRGEWRDQRSLLAYRYLRNLMKNFVPRMHQNDG